MAAVLIATTVAFLCERLLRSFDLLARSNQGARFLVELSVNLLPHYLGLTLPLGFFVSLFVVVNRLNADSEIDAMLASGISLDRIIAPFVVLGVVLMTMSIGLYGFVQPYARYGYRAVLHAAENVGWNGELQSGAVYAPGSALILTADHVDRTGQNLDRVFIRMRGPSGQESVLTARSAMVRRNAGDASITLELRDGQQLISRPQGHAQLLTFAILGVRIPLVPAAKLLRMRGGQETELTLAELAEQGYRGAETLLPRQVLLGELYARLAKALALPLMPLLAVPLALSAKRSGSTPAMVVAATLLFAFQTSLIFAQGKVYAGSVSAAVGEGIPSALFAAGCIATFLTSRRRPGDNIVNKLTERMASGLERLRGARR